MAGTAEANPVPSVWVRPPAAPSQPALSRAVIVRETIAMLDEEGIEALSMRKLGARLNAGATSLYRHVALKDELMELAVDEVLAEIALPAADSPDWRMAVTRLAVSFRATTLRHPWMCGVLGRAGLAYLGPNLTAVSERLSVLFTAAGFPEPHGAIDAVYSYVIGVTTTESAWLTTVAQSGQSEADFIARLAPTAQHADPKGIRDEKFAYGLEVVLDGLALRLNR
ncbi:TetR/AcrR family transcriptional regulator [Streptomyces subrutilus]|uniref:TetR family transcriptional regulator n=1 Tax=Streptomyces subrutilus TaxID=36818 RepID=A0A1E5Q073_9ACTN|nr:TetR/AcrR family transcriptional regulator C-terminal domain-containing protein [Streptomyces subrutilus]OEJ35080.1 TetR family transcriptional regulator [Streptomyces subrutilus]